MTNILVAIDPGVQGFGWAVFEDGVLVAAGLLDGHPSADLSRTLLRLFKQYPPTSAVVEIPQVYRQRHWKGDPNDLITVAIVAGIAVGALSLYTNPEMIRPHAWKGNRPKNVDNRFTLSKLTPDEMATIDVKKSKMHNVLDAIGIGLWKLKRR